MAEPLAHRRPRAPMDADRLVDLLAPFVTSLHWLEYGKAADASPQGKGKKFMKEKVILAHASFLQALYRATGGRLVFSAKLLKAALATVTTIPPRTTWFREEAHREDWVVTMASRTQNLFRDVMQAVRRRPPPNWVAKLELGPHSNPCEEDDAEGDGEDDGEDMDGEDVENLDPEPEWLCAWCPEMYQAYRKPAKGGEKEWCSKLISREPLEPAVAQWQDGFCWKIPQVLGSDLLAMARSKGVKAERTEEPVDVAPLEFFAGLNKATGLHVQVKRRADRVPLLSLVEGKAQICQVPVHRFKDPSDAAKVLNQVGQEYCDAKLQKSELKARRDELMAAFDLNPKTRGKGARDNTEEAPTTPFIPLVPMKSVELPSQASSPPRRLKLRRTISSPRGMLQRVMPGEPPLAIDEELATMSFERV